MVDNSKSKAFLILVCELLLLQMFIQAPKLIQFESHWVIALKVVAGILLVVNFRTLFLSKESQKIFSVAAFIVLLVAIISASSDTLIILVTSLWASYLNLKYVFTFLAAVTGSVARITPEQVQSKWIYMVGMLLTIGMRVFPN